MDTIINRMKKSERCQEAHDSLNSINKSEELTNPLEKNCMI